MSGCEPGGVALRVRASFFREATLSEPVFTLAVWDVRRRMWAALVTSSDLSKVRGLHDQLVGLVMVFAEVVAVPRADDDAVVAALAMLPKVHPEAVFRSYFDLVEFVSLDEVGPGPVGGLPLN